MPQNFRGITAHYEYVSTGCNFSRRLEINCDIIRFYCTIVRSWT